MQLYVTFKLIVDAFYVFEKLLTRVVSIFTENSQCTFEFSSRK